VPKDTFYNLPEEKRKKIVDAAIMEFGKYGFDAAGINRIVENSDISKGSFYQYFDDKKDLYKYILELIANEKLKYMSPVFTNPNDHDFFVLIRELYLSGMMFAKENPIMMEIGKKLLSDRNHPIYKEFIGENIGVVNNIFEVLLDSAIQKGEVRKDIDKKMVAYMISILNTGIVEYFLDSTGDDWDQLDDKMMNIVNQFINFLEKGIAV